MALTILGPRSPAAMVAMVALVLLGRQVVRTRLRVADMPSEQQSRHQDGIDRRVQV